MIIPWHDALCSLVDRLRTNPMLAGVVIVSGAINPDHAGPESIQFHSIEEDLEWRQLGPAALEGSATVTALVWVTRPGAGEDAIRRARERADQLRAAVIETLMADPTLGQTVQAAYASGATYDQDVDAAGNMVYRVTFRMTMTAWIRR